MSSMIDLRRGSAVQVKRITAMHQCTLYIACVWPAFTVDLLQRRNRIIDLPTGYSACHTIRRRQITTDGCTVHSITSAAFFAAIN